MKKTPIQNTEEKRQPASCGGTVKGASAANTDTYGGQGHASDAFLLEFTEHLLREAGRLALALQDHAKGIRKPDRTWVSEADYRVQSLIRKRLSSVFPTYVHLVEEDDGRIRDRFDHASPGVWVLDPIDGSDPYLRRMPSWGICLGLLEAGRPRFGSVFLPATGDFFYAFAGGPAHRNGLEIHVAENTQITSDALVLIPSQVHLIAELHFPGKLRSFGSTASHICFVASGGAQGAVFGDAHPWDIFAAGIVLEAAGGGLFSPGGKRMDLGKIVLERRRDPILVASNAHLPKAILDTFVLK